MALTTTRNEIIYSILDILKPNAKSNEPFSLDLIGFHVDNTRAFLIKQDSNKGYTADNYIIQDLGIVEIEPVDKAESILIEIGCNFMRTVKPIPSTIELHHGELLTRVGPIDKTARNYDIIKYERVPYEGYNKYTNNLIKAFRINNSGHIYLTVPKDNREKILSYINIQGVFENPRLAADFVNYNGNPCYTDDSPYPIKQQMVQSIKDIVLKNYGILESKMPIDKENDGDVTYKNTTVK